MTQTFDKFDLNANLVPKIKKHMWVYLDVELVLEPIPLKYTLKVYH